MSRSSSAILHGFVYDLLPSGSAWPGNDTSNLGKLLGALAVCRAAVENDILTLSREVAPQTAIWLLADYEEILGGSCCNMQQNLTISQRQNIAQARWIGRGLISKSDYIAFAARLGFDITITECAPARFGHAQFGAPMYGNAWAYAWQIVVPALNITPATFGVSRFGEPFRSWGNAVLECEMRARCPAHTILIFSYTKSGEVGRWDHTGWDTSAWGS